MTDPRWTIPRNSRRIDFGNRRRPNGCSWFSEPLWPTRIPRDHIASGVSWSHFPLFIMNKAVALAATVLVACSDLVGRVAGMTTNPGRSWSSSSSADWSGFRSLPCTPSPRFACSRPPTSPSTSPRDGRLNLEGELGLVVGIVALWALSLPAITTLPMMPKGARRTTMEAESADGVRVLESGGRSTWWCWGCGDGCPCARGPGRCRRSAWWPRSRRQFRCLSVVPDKDLDAT